MPRLGGFPQGQPANPEDLPTLIEELRRLMMGRDLAQLINSVVVPAMTVAHTGGESLADGDTTSSWAAKVEYLVGVALSVESDGNADTPAHITERVRHLISEIFNADQLRMMLASFENAHGDNDEREILLHQMRLEYQADRMPGYAVHLDHIDSEVFGRHRDYYLEGLGFDPADVIRATRRHARWVNEAFQSSLNALMESADSGTPSPDAAQSWIASLNSATMWAPVDLAACTEIPVEQITAMLDFFSTEFGCQPEFRYPADTNRARSHPCIKIDSGTYLVPDPWSMSAILHQRLAVEPKRDGYDPQKYHKHRQDAHERLVANGLRQVFGNENVCTAQHYKLGSGEAGEVDSLVRAEWPLIVEAKAIALTESGRRGAPGRVDKKLKEILGKALDQTDRALTYIVDEAGRSLGSTPSGRPMTLLPNHISGGTALIVTFERIDPFASGGLAVTGNVNRPTWVVSLTDLLMVVDILGDPATFHHYARTRADMLATGASAAAEADALGDYLSHRLLFADRSAFEQAARIFIGYSCEALNDFYTKQELGLQTNKPTAGVPSEITDALATVLGRPGWATCVDAVMALDSTSWRKWNRFRRRHRQGGAFALNPGVVVNTVPTGPPSLERVDGAITLNVPLRS